MSSAARALRFVVITAALAAAVSLLASGASGRPTTARADIAKITWALPEAIRGLEYTHSADSGSATVISLGCETLVNYDKQGGLSRRSRRRSRRRTRPPTSTTCARASSSGTASR